MESRVIVAFRQVHMTVVRPESPEPSPERGGRPSSFEVRGSAAAPDPTRTATPLRVLLATRLAEESAELGRLLTRLGHQVVGASASAADAGSRAATLHPDAILLDVGLLGEEEGASVEAVAAVAPGVTVLLYCGDPNVRVSDREVDAGTAIAYLPSPVPPGYLDAALRVAVRRERALEVARHEAAEARQQLEDRKLVERAKGVLMRRTGMNEQDTYSMMRRQSQDRSVRLVDIARDILNSEPGRRSA